MMPHAKTDAHTPHLDFSRLCAQYNQDLVCVHGADGKYLGVSESSKQITGYDPADLLGLNAYDFFHADDVQFIAKQGHQPALAGQVSRLPSYRFRHKNGQFIWLRTETHPVRDENSDTILLITVSRDVSEVVNLQNELERVSAQLEKVSRLTNVGAWEVNTHSRKMWWSQVTYDIHEVEPTEPLNWVDFLAFFPEEARPAVELALKKVENEKQAFDLILPFVTAKGRRTWVRSIGQPQVRNGSVEAIFGVIREYEEEIENQQRLKSAMTTLQRKNRQLEEFNQIVSHNLRSPVANLNTLVSLLLQTDSEQERREYLDLLSHLADNLNSLLEDLVDSVKVLVHKDVEFDPIDLWESTHHVLALLQGDIVASRAQVMLDFNAWSQIRFPKVYFESVLVNLLSNALKYKAKDRPPVIRITTGFEHGVPILSVSDNGSGIDLKRHGAKVFKLHKTFHPEKPGKGLGLFLVKNQVEAAGGSISLESEPGVGTTFRVTFAS